VHPLDGRPGSSYADAQGALIKNMIKTGRGLKADETGAQRVSTWSDNPIPQLGINAIQWMYVDWAIKLPSSADFGNMEKWR
jgi:hypothetical protein